MSALIGKDGRLRRHDKKNKDFDVIYGRPLIKNEVKERIHKIE